MTQDLPVPPPAQLKWLTLPLQIALWAHAITLLMIPFAGEYIEAATHDALKTLGDTSLRVTPALVQQMSWTLFSMVLLTVLALYFVRRGVLAGQRWAWVGSLVVGALLLLNFPLGTVLGLAVLYGALTPAVRAFFRDPEALG
ncbi:hypothetical protein ACFP81_04600 [Deinococcus lacus]|uniref:Uncharacterized protein n=1 Tax=Deinococcus lacus TaxID=392561 RepID=A0ABW1YD72_9DEIO